MSSIQIETIDNPSLPDRKNTAWITGVSITNFTNRYYLRFDCLEDIGYSAVFAREEVLRYAKLVRDGDITESDYLNSSKELDQSGIKDIKKIIEFSLINAALAWIVSRSSASVAWPYLFNAFRWLEYVCLGQSRMEGRHIFSKKSLVQQKLNNKTQNFPEKNALLEIIRARDFRSPWKKRSHVARDHFDDINNFSSKLWDKKGVVLNNGRGSQKSLTPNGKRLNPENIDRNITEWICNYEELCGAYRAVSDDKLCHKCWHYQENVSQPGFQWWNKE